MRGRTSGTGSQGQMQHNTVSMEASASASERSICNNHGTCMPKAIEGTTVDLAEFADAQATQSSCSLDLAGVGWLRCYTAKPASPSTIVSRIRGRSPTCHNGTSWRTR